MVLSTCENVAEIFETLRQRLHRNGRARQIGRLRVNRHQDDDTVF